MFFSKMTKFREWGSKTFKYQSLFTRKTKTGISYTTPGCQSDIGNINKLRIMPSLSAMGFYLQPYSPRDINILKPEQL